MRKTTRANQTPVKSPGPARGVVLFALMFVLVGAIYFLQREPASPTPDATSTPRTPEDRETKRSNRISSISPGDTSRQGSNDSGATTNDPTTATVDASSDEPTEESPVAYLVNDFRNLGTNLAGYKLENLEHSSDGIKLAPRDTNSTATGEPIARIGTLESPPLTLEHASNAVAPIWRNKLPENTSMQVEVSLSGDNKSWTRWYPVEPTGDTIEQFYPDGRPNPNFGAIGGGMISHGLDMYPFARYRVTLASGSDESPVLEEFRLFHADTTAGQGKIAGTPGEASPIETTSDAPQPAATPAVP